MDGTDSRLNIADITGGEHNKVTLNETSKFGPAITFFRGKLFLA